MEELFSLAGRVVVMAAISRGLKERDRSINTAATAVPLIAHPPIVAPICNSFHSDLHYLRVLSI